MKSWTPSPAYLFVDAEGHVLFVLWPRDVYRSRREGSANGANWSLPVAGTRLDVVMFYTVGFIS